MVTAPGHHPPSVRGDPRRGLQGRVALGVRSVGPGGSSPWSPKASGTPPRYAWKLGIFHKCFGLEMCLRFALFLKAFLQQSCGTTRPQNLQKGLRTDEALQSLSHFLLNADVNGVLCSRERATQRRAKGVFSVICLGWQ
jgi:hypothetical protein